MHSYFPLDISEEALKARVAKEFFSDFSYEPFGKIDFCISYSSGTLFESLAFLWAEAKRGKSDIYTSFVQLILTIGKADLYEDLPPAFLGAFDCEKIAFLPYYEIMGVFSQSDFNWNVAPSDYTTKEFKNLHAKIKSLLESKSLVFDFANDKAELEKFIATNFTLNNKHLAKIPITKNNFIAIYTKWLACVKPSISIDWEAEKPEILDSDFYLADLLSYENTTKEIYENLRILLNKDHYRIALEKLKSGRLNISEVFFKDKQKAHSKFWNLYERPPKEEFWDYIIERRDLLVPQDIRERKGAFFTPQIWVQKAQEYLALALGEDWQEEYYIWDCAAGTGNLLAGLSDKYKIYASTLDKADIDIIKERINNGANLLESHIFQFDFLNDELFDKVDDNGKRESKLPKSLQQIIKNEPHKLVIFINPPYSTSGNARTPKGTGSNKIAVAKDMAISQKYKKCLGALSDELYAQFFMRIYKEIPNCILGSFSTLKYISSQSAIKFRKEFQAKFLKGFMCPAWTFDNVNGQFPIGFLVWDLGEKKEFKKIKIDIFNQHNKKIGKKAFYAKGQYITAWLQQFYDKNNETLGILMADAPDFQNNNNVGILNQKTKGHKIFAHITIQNFAIFSVYFAVRQAIKSSWINDRDQFLYPKNKWQKDTEFHSDCLAFTLFHSQNRISTNIPHPQPLPQKEGSKKNSLARGNLSPSLAEGDKGGGLESINHFIPFSEKEVNAKSRFTSHFLHDFINGKCASSLQTSKASAAIHDKDLQIDCHESLRDSRNDSPSCHTEGVARSISNLDSAKNNRDISPTAQYDKNGDSTLVMQYHNDKTKKPQYDKSPSKSQSNTLFELESTQDFIPTKPLEFSPQAKAVFSAGLELWRYYHAVASDTTSPQSLANPHSPYNANASLYDIKEFFKGRKSTTNATNADTKKQGKLNATSKDSHFNALMASLNDTLANLAKKLEPKIYEYGFLEE